MIKMKRKRGYCQHAPARIIEWIRISSLPKNHPEYVSIAIANAAIQAIPADSRAKAMDKTGAFLLPHGTNALKLNSTLLRGFFYCHECRNLPSLYILPKPL